MNRPSFWRYPGIRLSAAGISLLVSFLMVLLGWLPNEDAFTYLRTVEIFHSEGLAAAYGHYPWATYPVLIGTLQKFLPLESFLAAVVVNAAFFSLLVYSFVSLVGEIDSSRTTLVLAAITVLVYPQLNENRLVIIRDSAFWSLSLFGLWQYLRYLRTWATGHAAAFSLALLSAATFRVEALALLFAIPFSLLADTRLAPPGRLKRLTRFTLSSLLAVMLLTAAGFLAGLNLPALLADQLSVYLPFARETFFPSETRTAEIGRAVFGDYAANFTSDYLPLFMLSGLTAILLAFVLKGIGAPLLLALLTGFSQRIWPLPRWQAAPLLTVIAVNALIAMAFLVTTRFLSSRYVILMSLIAVVLVPLLLQRLRTRAREAGRGARSDLLIGLLLVYCAIDAYVSFGADKSYLREAGEWLAENSAAAPALLVNNRTVAYYSDRIVDYDRVPVLLTENEILDLPSGSLVAFEEDTSSVGMFERVSLQNAVEEVIRIGPESGRQVVVYRRL